MSDSLRDRVEAAICAHLPGDHDCTECRDITAIVFGVMGEARPCVTCGRGLGPAKVAKGYVQCYDCTRCHPPVA